MEKATGDREYVPGYKNLIVYTKANELVLIVYEITRKFPPEELFCLTSQTRRCAISVPANIVEGYGRKTSKDKLHFYYIARGSLNELEYYVELALQLHYIGKSEYGRISALRTDVGKLLNGLINATK